VPTGFLLQILAIAVGGGMVQLIIFLLRRRGELHALDRTSSKPLLEEQGAFIDRLATAETKALARVAMLETRVESMTMDFAEKLQVSNRERQRIVAELASVRSELDICRAQVEVLRRKIAKGDDIL
jgi:uncharacterized protein YhaN